MSNHSEAPKGIRQIVKLPEQRLADLWKSIVVDEDIKSRLVSQAIVNFTVRPKVKRTVLPLHGAILLVGPPGTGKTSLASGLANEVATLMSKASFTLLEVDPHALGSAMMGKTQKAVSELFSQTVAEAAMRGPTIVLLDEVETLAVGLDGRTIRKVVANALASRKEVAVAPAKLTLKPSFLIEVMALECLHGGWGGQFDREIQSFFATLADRIGETWDDPAKLGPPISGSMDTARADRAKKLLMAAAREADHAIHLVRQGKNGEALRAWRDLFGPMFPLSWSCLAHSAHDQPSRSSGRRSAQAG